jgi:hypothetical protein
MRRLTRSMISVIGLLALVAAPTVGLAPTASAAVTTFSNTSPIGLVDDGTVAAGTSAPASLYPSPIAVSGQTGTVSNLTVTLSGINYLYSQDIGALLVGPTGRSLSLFTSVGSNSQSSATDGLNVTLDDSSATSFPYNTALPTSGSVTMKPADDTAGNFSGFPADTFPSPAPSGSHPDAAPTGSATLGSTFDGTNPNGTWSLYLTTDSPGDGTGSLAGGWSLTITTSSALAATTTVLGSSANPSFTSAPGNSVVLTAAVTSSSTPVTAGTVAFVDGTNPIAGCASVTLNGAGRASCTTSFVTEGIHSVGATYGGTSTLVTSGATLSQEVDNHTVVVGDNFADQGSIAIPNTAIVPGPGNPDPSRIFVSNLGTVTGLTVTLNDITFPFSQDLNALLVGPTGRSIILLSNVGPSVGTTNASGVSVTFEDSAGSAIPQNSSLGSPGSTVTSKPVDYSGTDLFPSPAPAGPYGTPAPAGSATLGGTFSGTNPNGTWSLYLETDGAGDGAGAIAGGWSLTFSTVAEPVPHSVLVSQLRLGGPAGPADSLVDLYNTTAAAINVTGWSLGYLASDVNGGTQVATAPLPSASIPSHGHLLVAGSSYSLTSTAAPDGTFGSPTLPIAPNGGVEILGPDGTTVVDAVGFASAPAALREGTGLVAPASENTQYAFVRNEVAGAPVNTDNNAADFVLVAVGGPTALAGSTNGAPSPADLAGPIQSNAIAQSALLDPGVAATAGPNRVVTSSPTTLSVRRTITNTSATETLTNVEILISSITTAGEPGTHADLVVQSSTPLTAVLSNGHQVTVEGLTLTGPAQPNGGGLDSVLSVPLPGGLAPGQSVPVAFSFTVPKSGTFSFGYDVLAHQSP